MSPKIKLITIDGDGCLFAYTKIGSAFHSSWDALAFAYGLKKPWDERSEKYYRRRHQSATWAEENAADMTGRPVQQAGETLYPIPYSAGAGEFLKSTRGRLVRGLLSGCIDLVGRRAAVEMELDFCFCNTLHTEAGKFSGTLDFSVPTWEKHLYIPKLCSQYDIIPEEICHVGDHENDISCFERVGLAVAFNPKKEEVAQSARYVIQDFRELYRILGLD